MLRNKLLAAEDAPNCLRLYCNIAKLDLWPETPHLCPADCQQASGAVCEGWGCSVLPTSVGGRGSVLIFGNVEELRGSSGINQGAAAASRRPRHGCPALPHAPACWQPECAGPTRNTGLLGSIILLMTLENCLPALEGAELMKSAQTWPGCD